VVQRRSFVTGGAAVTAAAVSAPAISQNRRKWRFVTAWPKNLPGLGTGAQYFVDAVNRAAGGRLTLELFAAGEIVPPFETLGAVASGTVEAGHSAPAYWKGKVAASGFLANFPFGLTAQEHNAWYYYGDGKALSDEVYDALGVKYFLAGNTGVQMGGWFKQPVNSVADLRNRKVRFIAMAGEVYKRLGATVVTLSGSEIVAALASGALDGLKWNNPYGEAAMGFWRYAKYYYHPGWQDPTTSMDIMINKKEWDSLPNDLKAIVEYCAASANAAMLNEFTANNAPHLEVFVKKHGVILSQFPDSLLIEFANATGEVVSALANEDPLSRKVFQSMLKWRGQQTTWTNMSERSFMIARGLSYKFPTA
jgi:TRAP-type mannitol/chloroaromatic compound transport system substrate-binding protein